MTARSWIALLVIVSAALGARDAHAIERQHHVGVGASWSTLFIDDKSTPSTGAGIGLHYAYGLNDQFNFMGELSASIVAKDQKQDTPDTPRTRPADVEQATVGVGYVIDVLRWVPYLCALGGAYRLGGGTLESAKILPGVEVGLGLDYQLSRDWAIGVAAREHLFVTKLSTYPSYTTVLLRAEYMWGF
jgi:opacity protein-like surface antigen